IDAIAGAVKARLASNSPNRPLCCRPTLRILRQNHGVIVRRTLPLPNPSIVIEVMLAVVLGTSVLTATILWSAATTDSWYLDHINAFIAALMALLAGHRLYLGVDSRRGRVAWIAILVLFLAVAAVSPFEGAMDRIEGMLGVEDLDDLCLWFVLPCALLVATRSERVAALPRQLLIGGFVAQTISTALDLFDDNLAPVGHITIAELVDFSEFVYLQLYFVGLTLTMAALYLEQGNPAAGKQKPWKVRWASTRLGYLRWRLTHWRGKYGEFYSHNIESQLKRGVIHRTLGTHTW